MRAQAAYVQRGVGGIIPCEARAPRRRAARACMRTQVAYVKEGLEAIVFTADGDMRQGLNNLQATHYGFGLVDPDAVFKVALSAQATQKRPRVGTCSQTPRAVCMLAAGSLVLLRVLSRSMQTLPVHAWMDAQACMTGVCKPF